MTVDKWKFSLSLFSISLLSFVFQICIFLNENLKLCEHNEIKCFVQENP